MASSSSVWRLGPVQLVRRGFSWQASVERSTGKAFAQELSRIPVQLPTKHQQNNGDPFLKDLLGNYPGWLSRGSVTLGLLQAVPQSGGGTRLQTRLFGINILTFGKPAAQKLALQASSAVRQQAIQWKYPIRDGLFVAPTKQSAAGDLVLTLRGASDDNNIVVLDTQLVAYRPRVVGAHAPANPMRIALYLGSQSVVHGYAMWRFHRFVRGKLLESAKVK